MTSPSHVTLEWTRRWLKIHYRTDNRGEVTGITNLPEKTEDEGNVGDALCNPLRKGNLNSKHQDGHKVPDVAGPLLLEPLLVEGRSMWMPCWKTTRPSMRALRWAGAPTLRAPLALLVVALLPPVSTP